MLQRLLDFASTYRFVQVLEKGQPSDIRSAQAIRVSECFVRHLRPKHSIPKPDPDATYYWIVMDTATIIQGDKQKQESVREDPRSARGVMRAKILEFEECETSASCRHFQLRPIKVRSRKGTSGAASADSLRRYSSLLH